MEITIEKRDAGTLVRVGGRMDAVAAPDFEKECAGVVESGEKLVVVDLAQLEYISSAGLRSILATAKKIKATGGAMKFSGLAGMVEEVFQVSGLGTLFEVAATPDEAF
ncbi:MAG: STAS domain-containing protein [Desulfovibrionaceae bacterium]|nr:STAS domain-containing protein [Desulfovibrionaceae bacterium]